MPRALASRYAQALADSVLAPGRGMEPRKAIDELRSVEGLIRTSAELRSVLLSPAVAPVKKRAVLRRFADSLSLSRLVSNFLLVLVDRRRIGTLDEIAAAFEVALDERMGFVRADVVSASPLTETQKGELQEALSRVAGKKVRCEFAVDPNLIGGVVARIGSKVYDGSVRTQLEVLHQRLVS
jgi:F-type H+-transporting ATPase subunit delta